MKLSKKRKALKILIVIAFAFIIFLGIQFFSNNSNKNVTNFEECVKAGNLAMLSYPRQCIANGETFVEELTNFEECVKAGNPILESYPRQCIANGKTFVEELAWQNDGVVLMQNSETGQYACFGCNTGSSGVALCIDPAPIMKPVDETLQRYCNDEFEVVE